MFDFIFKDLLAQPFPFGNIVSRTNPFIGNLRIGMCEFGLRNVRYHEMVSSESTRWFRLEAVSDTVLVETKLPSMIPWRYKLVSMIRLNMFDVAQTWIKASLSQNREVVVINGDVVIRIVTSYWLDDG